MQNTAQIQFPAEVTLKVLGKNNPEFEQKAIAITHQFFPDLKENSISQRLSKDNNYLSLSIIVLAENREQLDALYKAYTQAPEILAAL